MTANNMHTRAMLVNLSISAWSGTKFDRKVTRETNEAHGASEDAGRYNKSLMPKEESSFKTLNAFIGNLRTVNYDQTLPWSDTGWRLLPVANYQTYTDLMRTAQHEFNSLLDAFVADYATLRERAKIKLNGMFNDDDYPATNAIRKRYSFSIDFSPVPTGTDFRVTLAQSEIDVIAKRTEERVTAAFQATISNGKDGAVDRIVKVLSAIVEKCSDPKAIFRDSLIGNARELCEVLTRLNVTDSPEIETIRRRTELLATTEPQTLRDLPDVREDTAKQAQSILDSITATFGVRS